MIQLVDKDWNQFLKSVREKKSQEYLLQEEEKEQDHIRINDI